MLKANPLLLETMQCPIIKPWRFPLPLMLENTKMKKKFNKIEKKMAKLSIVLRVCVCSTKACSS